MAERKDGEGAEGAAFGVGELGGRWFGAGARHDQVTGVGQRVAGWIVVCVDLVEVDLQVGRAARVGVDDGLSQAVVTLAAVGSA